MATTDKGSVLVTGGARRIGRAICETLAARGWRVVVHARRADDADARDLAARLGGAAVAGDLAAPGAADAVFARAVATAPDLRALVNNASEFALATADAARAARLMAVNADAPQRLTALLHARLSAAPRGGGSVVQMLDCRILRAAAARDTPYAASKRALAAAVARDAVRFAPVLRVNGVAPGPVLPPTDATARERGGAILLAHRPTPTAVAAAVAFLLDADAVTGQIVAVDAGQSLL